MFVENSVFLLLTCIWRFLWIWSVYVMNIAIISRYLCPKTRTAELQHTACLDLSTLRIAQDKTREVIFKYLRYILMATISSCFVAFSRQTDRQSDSVVWRCYMLFDGQLYSGERVSMSLDSARTEWRHRSAGHGQWSYWRDWRTDYIKRLFTVFARIF